MIKKLFDQVCAWMRSRVTAMSNVERVKFNIEREDKNNNYGDRRENAPKSHGEKDVPTSLNVKHSSLNDSTLLRAEKYIKEHYHVRYNRLSREHELQERGIGTPRWQVLDEELCCTLLMEMQHAGIGLSKPYLVRTVVRGNKGAAQYHPVCDYMDTLPKWDGHDHIGTLFRRLWAVRKVG